MRRKKIKRRCRVENWNSWRAHTSLEINGFRFPPSLAEKETERKRGIASRVFLLEASADAETEDTHHLMHPGIQAFLWSSRFIRGKTWYVSTSNDPVIILERWIYTLITETTAERRKSELSANSGGRKYAFFTKKKSERRAKRNKSVIWRGKNRGRTDQGCTTKRFESLKSRIKITRQSSRIHFRSRWNDVGPREGGGGGERGFALFSLV